jgi:hypothetical protein
MNESREKAKEHGIQLLKILAFSGWALAIGSLFLGSYFLNKFHLEIIEMQRETKELKLSLEKARTLNRLNAKPRETSVGSKNGTSQ